MAAHAPVAAASPWVRRFAPLIPAGEVLDLACGSGRHARLLAELGHPVLAVDRDEQALTACAAPGIRCERQDLENGAPWPYAGRQFAGIVVTNYLHRPLFAPLLHALAPGGVLIYETFAAGNGQYGRPSSPDFLLQPGELIEQIRVHGNGMRVLAYEDGYLAQPKPALVQRICALRYEPDADPARSLAL